MLECVYERVARAGLVDRVMVATDDPRISEAACGFGAEVAMTRADHSTGTERVAEVAAREKADIIVNVQGDEPLIDPAAIDQAIRPLVDDGELPAATLRPHMATLKKRITDPRDLHDPNVVKVVTDFRGNAVYFSRSLIPFPRGAAAETAAGAAEGVTGPAAAAAGNEGRAARVTKRPVGATGGVAGAAPGRAAGTAGIATGAAAGGMAGQTAGTSAAGAANGSAAATSGTGPVEGPGVLHYKHIGLYVYQREFLLGYPKLRVGPLERAEKLEQLRALENGYPIRVVETDYEAIGVDTPEDLERVREMLERAELWGEQGRGGARHG